MTRPFAAMLSAALPEPPPAERILVLRLGALGDVVRTRFAFHGVRALYPKSRIDWLVEDRAAAGLTGIRGLDEVIEVPRRSLRLARPWSSLRALRALAGDLRQRRYDLALDFHGIQKSALLAAWAGIPRRIGYAAPIAREGSARWLTDRVDYAPRHVSRFERNGALVRFLGGAEVAPPPLDLPEAARAEVAGLPEPRIALHPGTSESTRYKRYPAQAFAEVARRVHERTGRIALCTWGPVPGERAAAQRVVEQAGAAARLGPETRSVASLLALLEGSDLFLGCDSGPMHLAALAGRPIVAVFGPTDPVENPPWPGVPQRILRRDVGCNPCRAGCPARTCLHAVPPSEVADAAAELLAAS